MKLAVQWALLAILQSSSSSAAPWKPKVRLAGAGRRVWLAYMSQWAKHEHEEHP